MPRTPEFRLMPKFISWAGLKPNNLKERRLIKNRDLQQLQKFIDDISTNSLLR